MANWLDKYDEGGPVNGWTTSAAGTAYNKAARQQPTNIDANAMQAVGQVTSYPQRKVTEWITGKNQYPSQAMGIQNPYGAFAVDAVLDPTNIVGAGLLGKAAKASSKAAKVAKVVANSGPNDLVSVMKGAGKKFLDTFVDPIKYKKDIEALKAVHSNLPNYINSPEITERLKNLGITNPSELTYPNLTFSRQGSYFDNLGNKINIDLSEPARYSNTHQFTHRGIYDHEIGHWLQREAYTKGGGYEKDFANFNDEFNKYKSKRDAWTQEHSNPYTIEAIASEPELPSLFPPLPIAKPTVVDDELIRRIVPNIKSRVGQKNYDYFKGDRLEAYPFMRETRREMIDQGYLPNEIANVNPSVVTNFLKANPKNRISSFSKPEFSTGLYLSSMMNKFPALAPVIGAGAIATATQEYNDGGPIQPNYNDASVSMSKDFVGMGNDTTGRNYSPAWGGQFAMGGSMPGAVGFTYARTIGPPAPSKGPYGKKTPASAQNGTEMKYYQEGLDFKPKSISKDGSKIIKDDRGQWAHPGKVTKIGSNQITMQGVPYPVLGISDTGDTQMMYPNQEYQFIGDSVTEYPMMAQGGQLTKLDQLTNFTNYNTKQPGGWLDKYQ